MFRQCLSIEEMKHLQELGLELKETMLYWARCVETDRKLKCLNYGKWYLQKGNKAQVVGLSHWEFIPAYTLQDILDLLPKDISREGCTWSASLYIDYENNRIAYGNTDRDGFEIYHEVPICENIIDAAYEMLCWCIEKGNIPTDK